MADLILDHNHICVQEFHSAVYPIRTCLQSAVIICSFSLFARCFVFDIFPENRATEACAFSLSRE